MSTSRPRSRVPPRTRIDGFVGAHHGLRLFEVVGRPPRRRYDFVPNRATLDRPRGDFPSALPFLQIVARFDAVLEGLSPVHVDSPMGGGQA